MQIIKIFTKTFENYSETNKWYKKIQKAGYNPYIFSKTKGYNILVATTPTQFEADEVVAFLNNIGVGFETDVKVI